eukprot:9561091-Prorocentrum_lima.AAC.1
MPEVPEGELCVFRRPAAFFMVSGEPFCQAERHHLGTMRWSCGGTRRVVCTSEADIFTFVKKHNPGLG